MQRRAFTLAGLFSAIGTAIGQALGRDSLPRHAETIVGVDPAQPHKDTTVYTIKIGRHFYVNGVGEPLAALPRDVKHWSEAQIFDKLEPFDTHSAALDQDIAMIIETHKHPDFVNAAIEARQRLGKPPTPPWCDGHHGPAILTPMTVLDDGRNLCGYCHKQEIDHVVQLEGSERGQAPSG